MICTNWITLVYSHDKILGVEKPAKSSSVSLWKGSETFGPTLFIGEPKE